MTSPPPYRWVILGAAFLIITMSIGTLFTLAVFLQPMEQSLGWSRASLSAIGFFNWIVMGAGGFVAGYVSDRFGTRIVVLVGSVLLGLGLVLSSQVTALWHFYVTFGLMVGGGVSAFYVPLTVSAVKWFGGSRGMAAAVVSAGNGLGILALSPLSRWLINEYEWRTAFVVLGDMAWLIVIPAALLLRNPPAPATDDSNWGSAGAMSWPPQMVDAGARNLAATPGMAALGLWRSWPFWAIALTHFACCTAHSGPLFHIVSHAIDLGISKMAAAGILGASGFSSIFGRIGLGMVADRVGAKPTLLAALALQAVMISSFLFTTDLGAMYGLALVFGVAYGGAMPLYALVTREYFGERVMGTAYGAVFFISCVGMGLGSYAGGAIYDALGSYRWLFLGSFAIGTMAVVLGATLRPPARVPAGAA
ncbi:MAG: MFS transporter [Candidatus Rokubacteria bacterium]|nr:MFS transporter [Candidatus Rokubacteria bacterium]